MAAKTTAQKEADLAAGAAKDALTTPTEETSAGGAIVQEVTIEKFDPKVDEEFSMEIVTTNRGTLGLGGIEKIGTKATINCSAFSASWMQPRTKADVEALKRYRASVAKDASA